MNAFGRPSGVEFRRRCGSGILNGREWFGWYSDMWVLIEREQLGVLDDTNLSRAEFAQLQEYEYMDRGTML